MPADYRVLPHKLNKVLEACANNQVTSVSIANEFSLDIRTVNSFLAGEYIRYDNFINICNKIGQDWQEIGEPRPKPSKFHQSSSTYIQKKDQKERLLNPMLSSPHTNIFLSLMEDKLERYVGREYVINAFEQFTQEKDRGYFILMGEPGEGKSTIAARYAQTKDCLFYFNVRGKGEGQNTATLFLENLCWQLIERYNLEKPSSLPQNATQNNAYLRTLLSEASRKEGKIVIVVDALDEVDLDAQSGYDSNALFLPKDLPKGVYFLLTSRRDVEKLEGRLLFNTFWESIKLEDFAECTADIEQYILNFLEDPEYSDNLYAWMRKQQQSEEEFIETLKEKSVRNFLYISLVLPEIAKPDGIYKGALLKQLPERLIGHYNHHWIVMGMNRKPYQVDKLKIICVICRAHEPVSCDLLARQSGKILVKVQEILNDWMQFLEKYNKYQPIRYKFYHESYREFVFSKEEVNMACGNQKDVDAEIVDNVFGDVSF
jgi:hypothetical protein